jgi:hypothetical protein
METNNTCFGRGSFFQILDSLTGNEQLIVRNLFIFYRVAHQTTDIIVSLTFINVEVEINYSVKKEEET